MTRAHNDIDLFAPDFIEDPYPLYASLRATSPVAQIAPETWLATSWALVTEAAARPDDFSSNLGKVLIRHADGHAVVFDMDAAGSALQVLATADEPAHRRHRKLVLPTLAAKRITAMQADIADLAAELWRQAASGTEIDWVSAMADRLPLTVVARLIGLPDSDVPHLLRWAYDSTELLGGVLTAARIEQVTASSIELAGYLSEHYARARRGAGNDLLGDLALAADRGHISDAVAVLILVQLVGAGGESTAGLIGNSARLLATRPALQDALSADPAKIPAFVDEALRLESPFRGHYREVRRDTTLGGTELPAGDHILLLWGAANRDPAVFDNPDDLVLDRPNIRDHVAFGRGIHYCVGVALARAEVTAALTALLRSTRRFTLHPDKPPVRTPSVFVRRHDSLPIAFQPA